MEKKEPLTNESLIRKFKSQFELVNYAIRLADQMIRSGRSPRVRLDNQNSSVIIIEEIHQGKDVLEDIIIEKKEPVPAHTATHSERSADTGRGSSKNMEKKKPRRILS